jgi:hypothetical protein
MKNIAVEITMNNRQNITTFDTRYLGNALGKTLKGKPTKERSFLLRS